MSVPPSKLQGTVSVKDRTGTCAVFINPLVSVIRVGIIKPDGEEISVALSYHRFAQLLRAALGAQVLRDKINKLDT